MNLKTLKLSFLMLLFGSSLNAQIIVDPTPTPLDLVQNTLIGPGLVTSNITFTGNAAQRGFFDGTGSNIGLADGVFLSSGNVVDAVPPNQPSNGQYGGPGDPDLVTVAQSVTSNPAAAGITVTQDAAILEFDFVPNGDVVIFNFVFASEEYTTYINTQFNDAFGFFISGPGYAGPYASPAAFPNGAENLAVVPGTTDPITISTIHPGLNASYYIGTPVGHSFNGFSIPIEIRFDVICDSTYHFKFAVADCVDDWLDTGVFLEGGSFQSIPVDLSLETNVGQGQWGDSVIFEGCGTDADFVFTRPSCQSGDSLWVDVSIGGTATNGTDYLTLPDSVLFLPGATSVSIPFSAFQDGVPEGFESVILTVTNVLPNGDTIVTTGIVWLLDNLNVEAVAHDTTTYCRVDSLDIFAHAIEGVPPYSFVWDVTPNDTIMGVLDSTTVSGSPNGFFDYYVTVIDACGFTDTDTLTLHVDQTLSVDTLISSPADGCGNPTGYVSAMTSGVTDVLGQPFNHWDDQANHDVQGTGSYIDATVWTNLSPGWYFFDITDDVCTELDSVYIDMVDPPIAQFTLVPESGCSPVLGGTTNESQNANTYYWDFGDGTNVNANDESGQTHTFTQTSTVALVAYQNPNCADTTMHLIIVEICGCTDPDAMNYDPDATYDDESCVFPYPEVVVPNIFTPNTDYVNNLFYMTTKHTVKLEYSIVNRWGNVMFEASYDPNDAFANMTGWNGLTPSGTEADEGTYFYQYVATGVDGTEIDGHGFVQLARD
ncbi:MAG: choice-of-anchor L domain-containing protein [Crocinitomicaceae bacterium]|nr:choice-of-anchor L domain-containing protein [Crocinitomicaceae bacterium]